MAIALVLVVAVVGAGGVLAGCGSDSSKIESNVNAAGVDATATVDSMQEVGSQPGGGHQIDSLLISGAAN